VHGSRGEFNMVAPKTNNNETASALEKQHRLKPQPPLPNKSKKRKGFFVLNLSIT
jgi:hypothetical protein